MAARLPVVASNVGGNLELIKNSEAILLVPPNDEGKFVDALTFS